ncbi:MAG: DNA-cytosine methyltransferase, partial [Bacteroidota bacterium]
MIRTIDLFSGCGGLSLGFQNAGFDVVAAFDNWQPAIDIYKCNFDHDIHKLDLANIDDYSIFKDYEPEIIIGGPPCQDFSSAGKRNEQERADLTIQFAKIVAEVNPKIVVMENVERIITTQALQQAQNILKTAGYGCSTIVLNASLCGVPQLRKRFFLIGFLNEKDNLLNP